MYVYRVVTKKSRVTDLSGIGAFKFGGRWNSKGTYMLYTSSNSSLAYLESLVHFDIPDMPGHLFVVQLEVDNKAPIYTPDERMYPKNWKQPELLENKRTGDKWMQEMKYLGIKVMSAINEEEYNYLLNPLFPGYNKLVKTIRYKEMDFDSRLVK